MTNFKFVINWKFDAPIEKVWSAIKHSETWSDWWKGVVRVVELKKVAEDGVGSIRRSTWKSILPYTLEFDSEILRVEKFKPIEAGAFGELNGYGLWTFELADGETRVCNDWKVQTRKRWMDLLAPIARPFFPWNHETIMR